MTDKQIEDKIRKVSNKISNYTNRNIDYCCTFECRCPFMDNDDFSNISCTVCKVIGAPIKANAITIGE